MRDIHIGHLMRSLILSSISIQKALKTLLNTWGDRRVPCRSRLARLALGLAMAIASSISVMDLGAHVPQWINGSNTASSKGRAASLIQQPGISLKRRSATLSALIQRRLTCGALTSFGFSMSALSLVHWTMQRIADFLDKQ